MDLGDRQRDALSPDSTDLRLDRSGLRPGLCRLFTLDCWVAAELHVSVSFCSAPLLPFSR